MARYWTLTLLGIGVFVASVATFCLELTKQLEIGTCASGGPYVIARECPEGTGLDFLLLVGSMLGLFVAAGLVLAAGHRPGGRRSGSLILVHGWTAFFTISGGVILNFSLTADGLPPDGKLGGTIVGVTFLAMGLPGLWFVFVDVRRLLRGRDERPSLGPRAISLAERGFAKAGTPIVATSVARGGGGGRKSADDQLDQLDQLDRLERLQRLRDAGTLNDAEFAEQKARILGG